jgi:hypothetical protein
MRDMQRRTIEEWLHEVIVNEGHRRFDDLHIDEIDPRYEEPSLWLQGIVAALNEAAGLRDSHSWPFTIAAGIALKSSNAAEGVMPGRPSDVVKQLDVTPPSLYAFPEGGEPWAIERQVYTEIPAAVVAADDATRCFFGEKFDNADREYRRTVWISR